MSLKNQTIIVDEFHMASADTFALCKLLKSLTARVGIRVFYLSATTPTTFYTDTNHNVDRFIIKENDVLKTIEERKSLKGLVIVNSVHYAVPLVPLTAVLASIDIRCGGEPND
jgi:superfamily II DNA or RNA helicase